MFADSFFNNDNFTSRRTTGNNMFDPEALLTGKEAADGMTYENSRRDWPSQEVYEMAVDGIIPADAVPAIAPRVLISRGYEGSFAQSLDGEVTRIRVKLARGTLKKFGVCE